MSGEECDDLTALSEEQKGQLVAALRARIAELEMNLTTARRAVEAWRTIAASLLMGTRILHSGQIVLIALTILPLVIITILCFTKAKISNLSPFLPYGPNSILRATKVVIFGFFGFEAVTALHALVDKPERVVPRAITWSIIAVSAIYITFVASTFLGIPRALVLKGGSLSDFLYALFPEYSWLITFIICAIIITIMGTIHALLWSLGSLVHSLSGLSALPFKITTNQAVIGLTVAVAVMSVFFKSIDLFFNGAALCIIIPLASAIWPLAANLMPSTAKERWIARAGIASAVIMCLYALEGIWQHMIS